MKKSASLILMSKLDRTSYESLILGIISVLSGIFLFFLIPRKPYGFNITQPVNALEEFNKFTFLLFFILLLCIITLGSAIVAIVFGIKDFRGIFRGAYITKGRGIYLIGAILGFLNILAFIFFMFTLFIL